MRKLYAILVTLLFVTSIFGVASIFAECDITTSSTTVNVGDTFTITGTYNVICPDPTCVQLIETGCGYRIFRALKPGTVNFNQSMACTQLSQCQVIVKILPKSHPIFSFMNILGFGKKK